MRARSHAVLAASVVLALAAGPLAAPAFAAPPAPASRSADQRGPDEEALRAAVAGLPNQYATAALVRVGTPGGDWHGSAGVRDPASGRPAHPDARFRAGSITKVVTAATVLRLAAQDEIDLDAPVQGYLPDLFTPDFEQPVSVRHLLNHTSGIKPGDGLGDDFAELYSHRYETLTPQQVAASAIAKGPEDFVPGTRQQYLNINYTILGLLIEKVTGRSYASEATRLVLRPAGMHHTYFPGTDPRIRGPHNRGYQAVERPDGTTRLVDVTEWNQADRWAAGDMISTTADLERLLTKLFRGKIVPQPELEEMFTTPAGVPGAVRSAGLECREVGGQVFWGKSGSRYGYSAVVAGTRDLSRTLVYSVNSTDAKSAGPKPVADAIAAAALQ
ncbi:MULTISPECIES: serine hydrolase domain-containing protein [Streptomyces violaceoruber group]|uniref:Serine hydrolase n=1 Tax=Streptomyces rubrogriseus TaxID=194673 RepID=A0ABT4NU06_9ACTN|nr:MULTISPECIES: serine hydrolase domain-containing protein [Streptomyces anthocyanicus group]MCW8121278.1 beta-lactamase family protein [Streptomyces anthocyanicus]MCZ4632605.1 serine hydrolase [Streptomyces rubrogriseus]